MRSLNIKSGQGDYRVDFHDSIQNLVNAVLQTGVSAIVIDQNVAALYRNILHPLTDKIPVLEIPATEEEKTLAGIEKTLAFFQQNNLTRNSIVLAIGGGIIQDIVTFSSHVYYRGIRWMYIPTTLLSMCDSCIGAKCGINFGAHKNQLGIFQSPAHVFISSQFTQTLSERDVRSGYGEMLKLIITGSEDLFQQYRSAFEVGFPSLGDANHFIYESLNVKKRVIEIDEYELDLRRILNYGHTFGHALESLTKYEIPHGSGVAWGLDLANFLGWRLGVTREADFLRIHEFVMKHFRFRLSAPVDSRQLVDMTRRDKKVTQGKANLILLREPGDLAIIPVEYDEKLYGLVDEFLKEYNVIYWD
ncbi:MAG TPA: hypothetical protein PLT08_12330 [Anaerolineales bacterium]|nr:hypothetical protein [Anaerolineales bacterium]